jgi:hypothetical protein
MVDEEGLAIAVVSLKLTSGDDAEGPAFGVPINLVKDLLEANGLLFQVPGTRLRPGIVHDLDWKGLSVELPDGAIDESQERLRVDTGDSTEPVSFLAARVATPASLRDLEEALLRGRVVQGFVPAEADDRRPLRPGPPGKILGSARGTAREGEPFRLVYALLEVGSGPEKVLARFLGAPEDMGFNLGQLLAALEGLEATPLLTEEVRSPLAVTFERVSLGEGEGSVALPVGWTREPTADAACVRVPPATEGLASSPEGDFTVSLRALRWPASGIEVRRVARACGQPKGTPALAYARRYKRMGVDTGIWGAFQRRGDEVLLLEVEAPQAKLPFVQDLYVEWLSRVEE